MTNALMHRDYSPYARGIQVQMELYSDRLEIRNPGGLYGGVRVEELGRVFTSSSRNAALAKLLEEVEMPRTGASVCENRGSGIARMAYAMQRAGKSAPEFRVTPTSVTVILRLAPAPSVPDTPPRANECVDVSEANMASDSREEQLIELLARGRDPVTSQRVQDALCLSQSAANRLLRHMIDSGRVLPTAPPRSHRRAYVLASGEVGAAVPGRVVSGRSLP